MSNGKRIDYFDFLRGIAILMVIGIHSYGVRTFDSFGSAVHIGVRESLNFAVPLFLAISGYFTGQKEVCSWSAYSKFIKKQIPRVYVPMLVWSLPMLALWIYNDQNIWMSMAKVTLCMTTGSYYFIALIIQLYLLLPLIQRLAFKPVVGGVF